MGRYPLDGLEVNVASLIESNRSMPHTEPQVRWMVPLSRKISAVIFLCILATEAVILCFTYFTERDQLLEQVDRTIEVLMPTLSPIILNNGSAVTVARTFRASKYPLIGVTVGTVKGQDDELGNIDGFRGLNEPGLSVLHKNESTYYYDRHVQIVSLFSKEPVDLYLRFDVSAIRDELNLFIFRVFLITLLITLLVIAGTLIGLQPLLFKPIQTLGSIMRRVDSTGLAAVSIPKNLLLKRDEIGDSFRAFKRMRDAIVKADKENRAITARFQGMADLAADCFFEIDSDRRFSFVAGKTDLVFGLRPAHIVGKTFEDLVALGSLPFPRAEDVVRTLREKGHWEGQLISRDKDKEGRTVKIIYTHLSDIGGNRIGARCVLTDTTLAAKLTRELTYRASHDELTGLYNRTEFSRRLVLCLQQIRVDQAKACVFVMDLDRFKYVNDRCGHLAGDEVLRRVADILRASVRAVDVIARTGGDEFAILLERCTAEHGQIIAEKIRNSIDRMRFEWDGEPHSVGASIGIVEIDNTYNDVDSVMLAADSSCFTAKRLGRNQVSVYSPSDKAIKERNEDLQLITLIEQGLSQDRCVLYQQPVLPLKQATTNTVHFEVLLRLLDESGEIIAPGAFLPCAERNGLIDGLDRRVINKVLHWLSDQEVDKSMDLTVSVNLSGASIADTGFQDFLLASIASAKISAQHLCFEITESAAVQNLTGSVEFLARLRALGCRIALDDFGTGFASLEYIKQLPLDFIKIDGAFIRDIAKSPLDQALVRCVSDVAHLLDVATIAELVEDEETIQVLNSLDIDFAQGYLISRPEPLTDLSSLLPAAQKSVDEVSIEAD